MKKTLGVLGGIGPMSSAYFYKLVTEKTLADTDQEHIDIIISSKASIPDRTAYILDNDKENPLPCMIEEAKKLHNFGADIIAITCNTAHFFYKKIQDDLEIPILNIGEIAVKELNNKGITKIGIMATTGTILGGIYQDNSNKFGMECIIPNENEQKIVMSIIYDYIKANKKAPINKFLSVANSLKSRGAQAIILGCTELSLIKESEHLNEDFVDPLEILAEASIIACGYKIK